MAAETDPGAGGDTDAGGRNRRRLGPLTVLLWTSFLALQIGLLATYLLVTETSLRPFHLYPFVWITLGTWAVWRTRPARVGRRRRRIAAGIAVAYLLVLGFFGGVVGLGSIPSSLLFEAGRTYGPRFVVDVPPGYGPSVLYGGALLSVALEPYRLIGYASLAYLVYVTILDAAGTVAAGLAGLFTCISCVWLVVASVVTGATGATGAIAATLYSHSYPLSTVAFVAAVALLSWRPADR